VVICLARGADLHMAQLMPLPFTISCSSKSRLVLSFWYRLTLVAPDKIQEGRKTAVCVCYCHEFGCLPFLLVGHGVCTSIGLLKFSSQAFAISATFDILCFNKTPQNYTEVETRPRQAPVFSDHQEVQAPKVTYRL